MLRCAISRAPYEDTHAQCWAHARRELFESAPAEHAAFPDTLTVREVQVDGQILVTTMLDQRQIRKSELSALYARRWNVELDLCNLKTTLGMEVLSCQTPAMIEKELWVYLLAYNLIRLLMAQAAIEANLQPRELSFKHTAQL